jgi:hypothetical protein
MEVSKKRKGIGKEVGKWIKVIKNQVKSGIKKDVGKEGEIQEKDEEKGGGGNREKGVKKGAMKEVKGKE